MAINLMETITTAQSNLQTKEPTNNILSAVDLELVWFGLVIF